MDLLMLTGRRALSTACLVFVLTAAGCAAPTSGEDTDPEAPRVAVAFYPLEFLVERIAGDSVNLVSLTPPGVDPHDVEFTPSQVEAATRADLIVYLGQGFQPALEDILDSVSGVRLDALEGLDLLEGKPHDHGHEEDDEHGHEEDDEHGHEEDDDHGEEVNDPHVWLDPRLMADLARAVASTLEEVDSREATAGRYDAAAAELIQQLEELDTEFVAGLASCERRIIVTGHEAFGYLAERYNLEQVGISGVDPETEPTASRLAEVSRVVREAGVTTIFFERLLPANVAETVARETGTETAVLDPLESPPEEGDYLSAMRSNLEALRAALDCE